MSITHEFIEVTFPREIHPSGRDTRSAIHYSRISFDESGVVWVNGCIGPIKETRKEIMDLLLKIDIFIKP